MFWPPRFNNTHRSTRRPKTEERLASPRLNFYGIIIWPSGEDLFSFLMGE